MVQQQDCFLAGSGQQCHVMQHQLTCKSVAAQQHNTQLQRLQQLSCKPAKAQQHSTQKMQLQQHVSGKAVDSQQLSTSFVLQQQLQQQSSQGSHDLHDALQVKQEACCKPVAWLSHQEYVEHVQQQQQKQQDGNSRQLQESTQLFVRGQPEDALGFQLHYCDCTMQQQQQQPLAQPQSHTQQYQVAQASSEPRSNRKAGQQQQQCAAHKQQQQQCIPKLPPPPQQRRLHTRTTPLTACWIIWLLVLLSTLQATPAAAALQDVLLPLNPGVYNPSLVVYQGSGWLVARSTQLKWDATGLKWIMNRAYLCQVNVTSWSNVSCYDFDPWRGSYGDQCRWGSPEWKVPWEAWGVDDTKLFLWPGKGLWAITGRRPQQPPDSMYCPQPVVWKQWLVQLAREGDPMDPKLFDMPPSSPANIRLGLKPGSGRRLKLFGFMGISSSTETQGTVVSNSSDNSGDAGSYSNEAMASSSSSSGGGSRTSDSNTVARVQSSFRRRRRHRAWWLNTTTTTARSSSSNHNIDFDPPYRRVGTGVRRRWKVHTRPGHTPPGLQQQQQQQWKGLVDKLPAPDATLDSMLLLATTGHQQLEPPAPPKPAVHQATPLPAAAAAATAVASRTPAASKPPAASKATENAAGAHQELPSPQQAAVRTSNSSNSRISGDVSSGGSSSSSRDYSGGSSSSSDGWGALWGKLPIPLDISDAKAVYGKQHSINEKNWMPFVWQGQLFVTYTLTPKHRVYRLNPNGLAEAKCESDPSAVFAPLGAAASKLHGGPPLVLVNFTAMKDTLADPAVAAATARQGPYYLGVAHFWLPVPGSKDGRSYHHHLIKMEAQPPFRVTQLSAELPVRYNAHYKRVAFVSGLDVVMLPQQQQQQQLSSGTSVSPAATAGRKLKAWRQGPLPNAIADDTSSATAAAAAVSGGGGGGGHGLSLLTTSMPALQQIAAAALQARSPVVRKQPSSSLHGQPLPQQQQEQYGGHKSALQQLAEAADKTRRAAIDAQTVHGDVTANMPHQQQQQQRGVFTSAVQQLAEAAEKSRQAAAEKQVLHGDTAAHISQQQQQQQASVHKSILQRLSEGAVAAQRVAAAMHWEAKVPSAAARDGKTAELALQGQQQQQHALLPSVLKSASHQLAVVAVESKHTAATRHTHVAIDTEYATVHNASGAVQQPQQVAHQTFMQQLAEAAARAQCAAPTASGTAHAAEHAASAPVHRYPQQQQQQVAATVAVADNGVLSSAGASGATGAEGISPVLSVAPPAAARHNRQQRSAPPPTQQQQQQQQQQKLLPYVLVSYGSGDWESHVTVMTLDDVEQLFMASATALDGSSSSSTGESAGNKRVVHHSAGVGTTASTRMGSSAGVTQSQAVGLSGTAIVTSTVKGTVKGIVKGTLKASGSGDAAFGDQGDVDYDSYVTDTV